NFSKQLVPENALEERQKEVAISIIKEYQDLFPSSSDELGYATEV
ncbi:23952_t:CDS:1, partial [Gigaspora margarita]